MILVLFIEAAGFPYILEYPKKTDDPDLAQNHQQFL